MPDANPKLVQAVDWIAALNEIASVTSQSLDLEKLFEMVLGKILDVSGRERGYIRLKDPRTGRLELAAHRGISQAHIDALREGRRPNGKSDRVFKSGEPLVIFDPYGKILTGGTQLDRSRAVVWIPMKARGMVVGILNVCAAQPVPFSSHEIELLQAIGNVVGVAVENARLFRETQASLERVNTLFELSNATASTMNLQLMLDHLLEKIGDCLPYSAAAVRIFDPGTEELVRAAMRNVAPGHWDKERWRSAGGVARKVLETKRPIAVRNVTTDPGIRDRSFFRDHGFVSYLGVPLIAEEKALGILSFYTKQEHVFSSEEIEFLSTIAAQAAVAIHNLQLHERLQEQATELERAHRAKDEFFGFVSHELKTPVNLVLGYSGMIKDQLLGEINVEQEQALEKVLNVSKELLRLINSLLEVAKMEAGAVRLASDEVPLTPFLETLRSLYEIPLDKQRALVWEYPEELPVVTTDRDKLKHILQNLINNAIQYTEKGKITVSVHRSPKSREVVFKVTDTGIGISKESLPTIFERFQQVENYPRRNLGGVGLGLHIVKKFTELLGGRISVESEPGKGSVFSVVLPYDDFSAEVQQMLL